MCVERDGGTAGVLRLPVAVVEVVAYCVSVTRVQQRRVRHVRVHARCQQPVNYHVSIPISHKKKKIKYSRHSH
jgi:hypothetical protein